MLFREPIQRGYPRVRPDHGDIAVDDTGVYLADETRRRVVRVRHGSTELEVIAADEPNPRRLTLIGGTLFWNNLKNVRRTATAGGDIGDVKSRWMETDRAWAVFDDTLFIVTARGNALVGLGLDDGQDLLLESLMPHKQFHDVGADADCLYVAMVYGNSVTDSRDSVGLFARLRSQLD